MTYIPDNWVVIKLKGDDPHYKILAGWSGGYTTGNSWRMNSGITRVDEVENSYLFYGASGSCYDCHKEAYGLAMNNAYVWAKLQQLHGDKIEMMDEDTNWTQIDWIIK